jgi:hypothetical protein
MVMMLSKEALEMVMMLSDPAVLTRANWQEYRPTETLILLRASKFHVVKNHCATLDLLRKRSHHRLLSRVMSSYNNERHRGLEGAGFDSHNTKDSYGQEAARIYPYISTLASVVINDRPTSRW